MWAISPSQMIFATQSPLLKQNLEYRERGNCRWKEVSTNEKHLQMGYHYFPVVQLKNIGHMGLLADMPVYIIISIQWCSEDKGQPSTITTVSAKYIQSKISFSSWQAENYWTCWFIGRYAYIYHSLRTRLFHMGMGFIGKLSIDSAKYMQSKISISFDKNRNFSPRVK